jgi:hypothetical protein
MPRAGNRILHHSHDSRQIERLPDDAHAVPGRQPKRLTLDREDQKAAARGQRPDLDWIVDRGVPQVLDRARRAECFSQSSFDGLCERVASLAYDAPA